MNKLTMLAVAGALAIVACDKPQDAKPSEPTPVTAPVTNTNVNANAVGAAQATTPPPVTIAEGDLVSPADFESEAQTTINAKNYKAEIASIETEMSKEP